MFHIGSMTENEFIKNVGENIAKIRKGKGLTQTDLAARLDMESSSLRRIENGRTQYHLKNAF